MQGSFKMFYGNRHNPYFKNLNLKQFIQIHFVQTIIYSRIIIDPVMQQYNYIVLKFSQAKFQLLYQMIFMKMSIVFVVNRKCYKKAVLNSFEFINYSLSVISLKCYYQLISQSKYCFIIELIQLATPFMPVSQKLEISSAQEGLEYKLIKVQLTCGYQQNGTSQNNFKQISYLQMLSKVVLSLSLIQFDSVIYSQILIKFASKFTSLSSNS
ncbi:unnamed protein product [Paramecium sonneborni]|uniref:Uncharacterized protein n=1 Tax=Paramecium sonneborni TaxID=65129 RepID=A0A8S1L1C0_9CILI|nr:unnamed protein product [Paramecium sonneborni]